LLLAALAAAALGAALLAGCGSSSSTGSDQFRDQTDSGVLDFGDEGSDAELEAAAEAVHGFFAARAEGDWQAACAQLSRSVLDKIEQLATSATELEEKSCPAFLQAFTRLTAQEREESTAIDAGSLRQQGARGFLVYYGARQVVYAMPLSNEEGSWKVASLSSKTLS
jgi:hypothetical protein